jgi:biopolymer transport protein ExbD
MSHAAGSDGGIQAEPDLTPMLDLVMQLLMYFIMCVHFIDEEQVAEVQLPPSQAARPIDKGEGDILFVNVDHDGKVLVLGKEAMEHDDAVKWLNDRVMDSPKDDKGKPRTAIVIRADRGASYDNVYWLLDQCKLKGFSKFKVRATMAGGGA